MQEMHWEIFLILSLWAAVDLFSQMEGLLIGHLST